MNYFLVFLAVSLAHVSARAQDGVPVMGMAQYQEGSVDWPEDRPGRKPVGFQTLFRQGDRIVLKDEDSLIKIVTDRLCTGIAYGPGTVDAPAGTGEPWILKAAGARWLCPHGESEDILLNGAPLEIEGGEIVFHRNRLLIRADLVKTAGAPLPNGVLHERGEPGWVAVEPQPNEYEKWRHNESLRLPKEGLRFDRPSRDFRHRLIFSLGFGGGGLKHEASELEAEDMEFSAASIQYQRQWGDRSLILGANVSWLEQGEEDENFFGPTSPKSDLEMFGIDAGIRWNHQRTWAFFTKLGLARGKFDSHGNLVNSDGEFSDGFDFETHYTLATLAVGVEKIFFKETVEKWGPLGLHGLYGGLELRLMQSLGADLKEFQHFTLSNEPLSDELLKGKIFAASLSFNIGLPFGF